MACGSATADPLPYTSGYTPDPTIRRRRRSTAMADDGHREAQQMSGLPQSGTGNYNVFKQEDNTSRSIKAF